MYYNVMQYNIYFRKDNWERFKDEENKSGLINYLLETHYGKLENISASRVEATKEEAFDIIQKNYIEPKVKEAFVPKPPDPETGYPCCTKDKPCKHWVFDGTTSEWRNTITGKTRDVAI